MSRIALSILLLAAAAAAQEEDTLLSRLERETRALGSAATAAVVQVGVPNGVVVTGRQVAWPTPAKGGEAHGEAAQRYFALDALTGGVVARKGKSVVEGVLAGSPARVVVPFGAVGKAATVKVTLADGREVEAQRLDGDAELGVAVFSLPDDVARGVQGLAVPGGWDAVAPGSLAVGAGTREGLGLTLVQRADPRLGTIDAADDGAALVGTRRLLLGLRTTAADWASCARCHQTDDATQAAYRARPDNPFGVVVGGGGQVFVYGTPRTPKLDGDRYVAGPVIRRVLDDLENAGHIRHGYLGVVLGDTVGQGKEAGVLITAVLDDSPAAAAGLEAGQRVAAVDGLGCPSTTTLSRTLALRRPGETVTLKLAPDGKELKVTLADRAAAQKRLVTTESMGMTCVNLESVRALFDVGDDVRGVVVKEVHAGGSAAAAGLRRGDVITWGGGGAIGDVEELDAALAGAKGSINLRGLRGSEPLTVTLKVEESREGTR